MANEEYLKFEITDDDLRSEFNPFRSRRRNKEEEIYGIWAADDDSDSDDDNRRTRFGSKKNKNYSAPVNFVSAGIHQPGKKPDEPKENEDDDEINAKADLISDSSDEETLRPSFSSKATNKKTNMGNINTGFSEMAGFRTRTAADVMNMNNFLNNDIGHWETFEKGIGSKILMNYGFEPGKGLGKNLQGISVPIEAHLRKGRGAIGAYGPEKKPKKMPSDSAPSDEAEKVRSKKSGRSFSWRKEGSEVKKQISYKSVDDLLKENKKSGIELSECSKVKVIDMTGPQQRVLSGYHAIAQKVVNESDIKKDKLLTNFSMPELEHNINCLIEVSAEEIRDNKKELENAEKRLVKLEKEINETGRVINEEESTLRNLEEVVTRIDMIVLRTKNNTNPLTSDEAKNAFELIKVNYYNEFCLYDIPLLAVTVVKPMFEKMLERWSPLQEPQKHMVDFIKWRDVLTIRNFDREAKAYQKLLCDTWIPCVRRAANTWQCRDWRPMRDVLITWASLLPDVIREYTLEKIILKRIKSEVEMWDPLTDRVPIHEWIHPWIDTLGKSFEIVVYPTIRQKLSAALVNWHPSDRSARFMLGPWVGVFEMESFLVNNIVPKLQTILQEFIINPHQQILDNWNWVMEWCEMLPAHAMAALLDRYFFPKWLQTLNVWLKMNPNFDEINKWFTGWKTRIPDYIKSDKLYTDHIRTALKMMSDVARGGLNEAPMTERVAPKMNSNVRDSIEVVRNIEIPVSLKAMVQAKCEEKGILWRPSRRLMDGRQVYECGKFNVYFDRNVLFVSQAGGSFTPMSWQDLLDNAV